MCEPRNCKEMVIIDVIYSGRLAGPLHEKKFPRVESPQLHAKTPYPKGVVGIFWNEDGFGNVKCELATS
jgi:hypothetical protein